MLKETSQDRDNDGFRRVYVDSQFELMVWSDQEFHSDEIVDLKGYSKSIKSAYGTGKSYLESSGVTGFQIIYQWKQESWALNWSIEEGFTHFQGDTGVEQPDPSGFLSCRTKFLESCQELPRSLRQFLEKQLERLK